MRARAVKFARNARFAAERAGGEPLHCNTAIVDSQHNIAVERDERTIVTGEIGERRSLFDCRDADAPQRRNVRVARNLPRCPRSVSPRLRRDRIEIYNARRAALNRWRLNVVRERFEPRTIDRFDSAAVEFDGMGVFEAQQRARRHIANGAGGGSNLRL